MINQILVMSRSSMAERQKMDILSNELVRRLSKRILVKMNKIWLLTTSANN